MSKIIGIDLGTGNSCVAVVESGNATVITNAEGARTTPSIVGFGKDGERKVGDAAKRQAITNPNNTVHSVKRFIGCTEADCKEYIDKFAYTVECQNGLPVIKLEDKTITPQEISAAVLQKMKKTAEDYLGEEVTEAVITVPAYFNDGQRKATKEAGEIAGLTVRRIINEPTAAALAFGIDKMDKDMKVLVYDVGAGTADVSVLDMGDGVFEVLATNGDTFLGGDDIDNKIIDLLAERGISEFGTDLRLDPMAHQRLKEAAEKAKIELSSALTTEINLPYITVVDSVPKHLVVTMSRAQLNGLIEDFTDKTLVLCKDVLKAADLSITDIDEILLVGGTTRIPYIQEKLTELFGKEPNKSVNPDEAVAIGAAIQGSVLAGEQTGIVLLDVTPLNLNITTMGQVATCMIEANTTIPTSKTQIFSTAADNQPAVDIEITQGNRPLAKDNKHLGVFILDGIIPAKRGVPQIEVTFELDANGILEVKATDKATGKEQNIRIEGSSGLSADEIERMRADAEAHADEDKKKMEFMELLNNVESTLMRTESSKESLKEKLTEEDEKAIDDAVANLKAVYEVEDPSTIDFDALKAANDAVNDVWNNIMVKLYSAQVGDDGSPVTVDGAPDGVNVTSVQVPEGVDPSKMSQEELQEMLNKMGINVNESGVVTPEE